MLTLYYNAGSCSLASHAALEEAGLDYELVLVDLSRGAQFSDEYRRKNPWGRVPAISLGDGILTENVAILNYIADLVPERELLPSRGEAKVRALEWLALLSSTVHVAFRPIFRPNRLAESEEAQREVSEKGLQTLNAVLWNVDAKLGASEFTLGDKFSLCDLYLFVFAYWTRRPALIDRVVPLPNLDRFADHLAERASVRAALTGEGISLPPRP